MRVSEGKQSVLGLISTLGASPRGVALLRGPEHVCIFANAAFLRHFQRDDVVGRPLANVLSGPEQAMLGGRAAWDEAFRSGAVVGHWQREARPGEDDLCVQYAFVPLGEGAATVGLVAVWNEQRNRSQDEPCAERLARKLATREELRRLVRTDGSGLLHCRARRAVDGTVSDFELLYLNEVAGSITRTDSGRRDAEGPLLSTVPPFAGRGLSSWFLDYLESGLPVQTELQHRGEGIDAWYRVALSSPRPEYLDIAIEDVTDEHLESERRRVAARTNEVLLRVARAISGLDLQSIVQAVTDEATSICRAEFGAFFYNKLDAQGESYMLYTLSGVPHSAFDRFPMPRNTDVFGPTFRGEGVIRADDVKKLAMYGHNEPYHGMPAGHLPVCSYLAVPVISRTGEVLGGLFFGHSQPAVFSEADERTVLAIAQQAAAAMDSARLFELAQHERRTAEEASRMKDDFLATISHELRTPLQSILGWTHMLRGRGLNQVNAERALAAVERNAKAQAALIEDILDVSRIITGKLRIEVAPVNLVDVVRGALETVRPAAEAKGVRLNAVLDPDAGLAMGDANRLLQVVWNLLSNAVKFSSKHGSVYVHLRREHSAIEIMVADRGQGIPLDFLPYVFDRFRQLDGSITRKAAGLGLGLSIVKHLVELHGGTALAESPGLGHGATFTVRIPVAPLRSPSSLPPPEEPSSTNGHDLDGLCVLVVDDEADTRELLQTILEGAGATVATAASSAEAFVLLRDKQPHVLISDIGMPDEDGYALIARVRGLPGSEGGLTPAVALTAYARSEDRTKALRKGFNHHLAKPVDIHELLAIVGNFRTRVV